ncbi:MAG: ROK family transcriptional regulator [Alphaproteobacteria bacterium]
MLLNATNIVAAKQINLWVVFEAIRLHQPIPRTRIADVTGLSKQAVSNLVDELERDGLVVAEEARDRRIGKPPSPLRINPAGPQLIGCHINHGRLVLVVTNLAGDVLERTSDPVGQLSAEAAASTIRDGIEALIARSGLAREAFLGIGVATPGPFGVEGISPPRLPGWDGLVLRRRLAGLFDRPVVLANDGQCAVTAEWRFGAARDLKSFVYVFLGTGLGSGVMINGSAFGGMSGNAGEFGHLIVVPDGHACICGNRGCLETYMSVDAAMRFLAESGVDVPSTVAFEEAFDAGHPQVAAWLDQAIGPLRIGLNALENLFDPETVMLGGDAPAWLIDAVLARLQPLLPSVSRSAPAHARVTRAGLDQDAVARGAAALPLLAALNPRFQQLV